MHRVWRETLSANANVLLPLMPDDLLTSISRLADAEGIHVPRLSPAKISTAKIINTPRDSRYQHKRCKEKLAGTPDVVSNEIHK